MLDKTKLKPYQSLIIAEVSDGIEPEGLMDKILTSVENDLDFIGNAKRQLIQKVNSSMDGDIEVGFFHYSVLIPPSWTNEVDIEDRENHLFLAIRYKMLFAFYLSESNKKGIIVNNLLKKNEQNVDRLKLLTQKRLSSAFLQGDTRTLWLSGIHRRTQIKADSKILAGLDLRYALDPLADQTYYYTAARSITRIGDKSIPIGCSPKKSSIWSGGSKTWIDFKERITQLLIHIDQSKEKDELPFPVIAEPVSLNNLDLSKPYALAFFPPELDDPSQSPELQEEIEYWGNRTSLQIMKIQNEGLTIEAELQEDNRPIGILTIDVEVKENGKVKLSVKGIESEEKFKDLIIEGCYKVSKSNWLKIWYESGFTLADGQLYQVRFRDIEFRNIEYVDFLDFDTNQEKPQKIVTSKKTGNKVKVDDRSQIGNAKSLFDWVIAYWPNKDGTKKQPMGWLVCDDGAMEIADFIHFGVEDGLPVINLIHVKANSTSGISVSDYEIVASQAVKNLRWLDSQLLEGGLIKTFNKKADIFIWHDGTKQADQNDFIKFLETIDTNIKRRVIILQPSLSESKVNKTRKDKPESDSARLRQLDTLLYGVEANCRAANAEFLVIGSKP